MEPNARDNDVLGFGQAQVFSDQMSKFDWAESSAVDRLAFLQKLYRIVKGNFDADGNESFKPLLDKPNSIPLSNMEAVTLPQTEAAIDIANRNGSLQPLTDEPSSIPLSNMETVTLPQTETAIDIDATKM